MERKEKERKGVLRSGLVDELVSLFEAAEVEVEDHWFRFSDRSV